MNTSPEISSVKPKSAGEHNALGNLLFQERKLEEALTAYRRAIALEPDLEIAHCGMGKVLFWQGKQEEAIASYQEALRHRPNCDTAKLGITMAQLPIIYADEAEIESRRSSYRKYLENLADSYQAATEEKLAEAATAVGSAQPFLLAYQGLNDHSLQKTYGEMICRLMANRYPQWRQPLPPRKISAKQKVRLGIVSGFFNRHSVWKIPLQGWIENLDRSEFELFGYFTGNRRDPETARAAAAFDRFDYEFHSVSQWASRMAQDKLDVLIFPEFGMDSMTIQLGCLRLAPVQAVFGGHPETSGLPTINYHLSSDLMEPANAQSHYTEQLVRLPNLAVCYQPIPIEPKAITKADLGIAEHEVLFWCCQSLFKYLPQHDDVFPRIAQKMANAKFVFIELENKLPTQIFCQRLEHAFQKFNLNYQDYCLFLPRLDVGAFAGTTAIADVFLDNIGWSGNNTTMESTAYDLPIVTLPGEMMRSRHTMAILTMMGITETIAQDKEQYIEIAVRLGQDADYRQNIAQQIAQNKHKLYQDLTPVRALEDWLLQIIGKPRISGNTEITKAFQLAEQYYHDRCLDAAQKQYLQVLAAQPDHADALYRLGTIAQQQGRFAETEQYLAAATKAQPEFLKAWFSLGNLYQSKGQLEAAEQAYRQALSLRPDSAPICNNLGYVLQQQDKWSAAASYYKQALELMPNCTEADVNWGNALFAQGKLSTEQQRHYAELNHKLGLERQRAKDWQTASTYFRQAIDLNPDLVAAHYYLGLALQEQRKLEEALGCYQQVLQLNPDFGQAYYNLGKIYQDQGDLQSATTNFKQALKLINPHYAQALESSTNSASFAEHFTVPQIPQGEVIISGHKYPAIPPLSAEITDRPFWSVVIPVVNRPEYFSECLASVLAQWTSAEDMEIIVLDNGSQPPQWQIPEQLGKGIIRYYRLPETIPLQENWNTAVSLCRGQWIHLLHHDDYVLPGFYERFKASLATCPESVGAAFTGHQVINEERQVVYTEEHGIANYRGIFKDWIRTIGVVNTTSPPSLLIKRTAYEQLGGYKLDLLYTCDWELYKRIASFADWWYEPGILAHYRQQANSITISENTNGASGYDHLRAIEISQSYLPQEYCAEITAKSRINYFGWCLRRATIPLQAGNLDGAWQLIQAAIKINSSVKAIAELRQWSEQAENAPLRSKVSALAQQTYQQILEHQPQNTDALYGLGSIAQKSGNLPTAEQLFRDALEIQPKSLNIWFELGNLYYAQTKLPEAEECYQRVLDLQPNLVSVYNNLGYVQQQQGKFAEAINSYQKALEIEPNCIEAELNLASVLHSQGQLSAEKQADYAAKNNDLGMARQAAGDYQTAMAYYQQAIALQPDLTLAHYNLGRVLQIQRKSEPAISCYERALELKPEAADIHYAIADILQQQDKCEQASDRYQQAMEVKYSSTEILKHSPYDNIYYCCTQKTASQWFRSVFNDPIIYQYTGLVTRPYVQLGLRYASLSDALPLKTIGTHLYINYATYLNIPKSENYKTFFVLRDPRDAVISWYFSAKYSHVLISVIPELRRDLEQLNFTDGLKYIIDRLDEFGYFEAQRSWLSINPDDPEQTNIAIFRYEDLVVSNHSLLRKLLSYLEIKIPEVELIALGDRYKFETMTRGRSQGSENINSHYRKGISGDWKNHFDRSTLDYFYQVTHDLVETLGYQ